MSTVHPFQPNYTRHCNLQALCPLCHKEETSGYRASIQSLQADLSEGHSDLQWLLVLSCLFILYCFPAAVPRNPTLIRKARHIHISLLTFFLYSQKHLDKEKKKVTPKKEVKEATLASPQHEKNNYLTTFKGHCNFFSTAL